MAEQAQPPAAAPPTKSRKKTIMMVAVILLLEAVVIVGAMWKFVGGHPSEASAGGTSHGAETSDDDKIVEALVLEAKMPNNKSGVTYIYPAEIYVQVRNRHAEKVKSEIEQFQNEIKADITAIWRTAEPQHFQEPKLENLTRKVYALLNERFGMDNERKEPLITKVVIVMSTGFRVDT